MQYRFFIFVAVVFIIFGSLAVGLALGEEDYEFLAIYVGLVVLVMSVLAPRSITFAVIVLVNSSLTLPQLQGKLNLFHLAVALLGVVVVVRYAYDKTVPIFWSSAHAWLLAFGAVIAMTIFFRGVGLRVLGGSEWGGMFYIQLFLTMSLVFTLPRLTLAIQAWRPTLVLSLLAAFLPAIATLLVFQSGFFAATLGGFIQTDAQVQFAIDAQEKGGLVRYTGFGSAGQSLFNAILLFFPVPVLFSPKGIIGLIGLLISFVFVGFSGYRTAFLSMFGTLGILMVWVRAFTLSKIILSLVALSLIYTGLIFFTPSLPPTVQRMVSFIPGVDVAEYVDHDAYSTMDWRFQLWMRGIQLIPQYWVVGKGYAFSGRDIEFALDQASGVFDPTEWAVVNCSFHQGILSLLVGLGLPGLVTGLTMFVLFVRRHVLFLKEAWVSAPLRLCHQVMTAFLFFGLIKYIFIYGDIQASFPEYFFTIAVLEGLWATNLVNQKKEIEKKENAYAPAWEK